ncbi:MAG: DUF4142 domain-containing protein [Alphaproteobacteria bacterium]|nr:DUF4142 domain-containing protein [Alphaproteobacteria bacterium]
MQKTLLVAALVAGLSTAACSRGANDQSSTSPSTKGATGSGTADTSGYGAGTGTGSGDVGTGMGTGTGSTTGTGGGGPTAALDPAVPQTFFTRVAMSDMLEIEASRAALQKTQNAEVRKFAQMMIADHTKTTQDLTGLAQGASLTVPAALDGDMQAKVTNLQNADAAGFDDKYLDTIIDGHEAAISDFEAYAKNGKDAKLKAWATKTLPTLRKHKDQAEAVRKNVNRS